MTDALILAAALASLLGAALFSGAETGLYCQNRLRLLLGVQRGDVRAVRLSRWLEDEQSALAVTLSGTNLMHYLLTTCIALLFSRLVAIDPVDTELYTVLLTTPVVFVFCEVVPKNLFQRYADTFMLRISVLLRAAELAFRALGVVALLTWITGLANRGFGAAAAYRASTPPKRRVAMLLQEALAGQTHGEHQSDLIDRVVGLSETPVRKVMVPFHRVVSVSMHAGMEEVRRLGRTAAFARLPVHGPKPWEVIGMVKLDELLRSEGWTTVAQGMHPITTLAAHSTAAAAIAAMRRSGSELAAVVDPAGRMVGLVTVRDLLEEVVGELGRMS